MTGGPAAAALHERLGGALAEMRACVAGHTGGAFQTRRSGTGPGRTGRAYWASRKGSTRRGSGVSPTGSGAPPTAWSSASSALPFLPRPTSRSRGCAGLWGTGTRARCSPARPAGGGTRTGRGPQYVAQQGPGPLSRNGGGPGGGSRARVGAGPYRGREGASGRHARPGRNPPDGGGRLARMQRGRIPRPRPRRPMPGCRPCAEPGRRGATAAARRPKAPRCRARAVLRHRPPPRRPPPRRPPRACPMCSSRIPLPPAPLPPRHRAVLARRLPGAAEPCSRSLTRPSYDYRASTGQRNLVPGHRTVCPSPPLYAWRGP